MPPSLGATGGSAIQTAQRQPARGADDRVEDALALYRAGRVKKAEALCRQVLRKQPRHGGALQLLASIARAQGRGERAVQMLQKAVGGAPDRADLQGDLGNALKALERYDEAALHHEKAVALCPDSAAALSNLGSIYARLRRFADAERALRQAVGLRPAEPEIHYNLGNALLAADNFADAAEALRRATALAPGHARAHANLGIALKEQGRTDEAVASFRHALTIDPTYADSGFNMALALLAGGQWEAGWAAYEWRRRIAGFAMQHIEGGAWDGADLGGRTLLVHAEQGLGDSIQFARYLAPAMARGGNVVFACQGALVALLAGAPGMGEVVSADDGLPRFEVQAPLMSLPHLLGGGAPRAAERPYRAAQPDRAASWRARLAGPGIKIGICWQRRPGYQADRRRSLPLAAFAPLAEIAGVHLFSLQKGPGVKTGAEQLAAVAWRDRVADLAPELDHDGAFLDSAAAMAGLDLVVTSDTAIAHLAGALGVEAWVALSRPCDWRWGLAGETTPWYPTMRLFRQHRPGDWPAVFARIATELRTRIA